MANLDIFVENFFDDTVFDSEREESLRILLEELGVSFDEKTFEKTKDVLFSLFYKCLNLGYGDGHREGYEEGFSDGYNDYNVK